VASGWVSIEFLSALSAILCFELVAREHCNYPKILQRGSDGNNSLLRERLATLSHADLRIHKRPKDDPIAAE
jgi:hypothetical protein